MDWFFEKETLKTPLDYLKITKFTPFFYFCEGSAPDNHTRQNAEIGQNIIPKLASRTLLSIPLPQLLFTYSLISTPQSSVPPSYTRLMLD